MEPSIMNKKLFSALCVLAVSTCVVSAADKVLVPGLTEPIHDVTLSSSVPGIVREWKFKEGDFVKENDVIITLDKKLEQLEVDRRKLVMENRKAEWDKMVVLSTKNSLSLKKEDLEKADT